MFSKPKFLSLIVIILLSSCNSKTVDKQIALADRIDRIENGLQSNLRIHYRDSIIQKTFNIEERMGELKIPGVSIAVLNNGVLEWAKGYGIADSLENRKVDTETLFQAGSISKPVAATRAMQLAGNESISLDEDINTYLTTWNVPSNEFTTEEKVTTRRILNHTAGLTVSGFLGYKRGETIPSLPNILDGKGNTEPVRVYKEPGGSWSYSGGGYSVLQQMIIDFDQSNFPSIMKQHVLSPLGMASSTYKNPLPDNLHKRAATGYNFDGSQVEGKWWVYPEMAAAGLWTTPSELILWAKTIQKIYQTQEDGLLKASIVNEMLTPNEDSQGLGPYVLEHFFGHGGADEGFRANVSVWKETPNAVVIMVNSQNGNTIIRETLMSIAQEYGLPGYSPRTRVFKELSKEELEAYTGVFDFQEDGQMEVAVKEDGLELTGSIFSDPPIFLWPESDSTFFNRNSGTRYQFSIDNGQVKSVSFSRLTGTKLK